MTSYDISIPLQILAVSNMILHISMWQEINLMFLKMSFVKCYRCVTYRSGGNDLLCDDPQRVHHRDVAQPPSNTQSSVTILDKNAQWNQTYIGNYIYLCIYIHICVCGAGVSVHTTVIALGLAPFCSRTLMMCVFPCWAAWWRGVYPFWEGKNMAH